LDYVACVQTKELGVAYLMRGPQNSDDQPDPSLGKSLREGFRNLDPCSRSFGLPSVRTDLAVPRQRSVANVQNYGNEPDVFSLLAPGSTAERCVPAPVDAASAFLCCGLRS
jgi:EF-hand domain-containing family member B